MCSSWKLQRVLLEVQQAELAREAGISIARMRAIEHGKEKPTPNEEKFLLAAFRKFGRRSRAAMRLAEEEVSQPG